MAKKSKPSAVGKETGSSRIYTQLRNDILRLRIRPGTPLDENNLSERFGYSRSPVREALVRLSGEGLVHILPNRSTVVAPIDMVIIPQFLDALDLIQRVTTRSAARFRTEDDLEKMTLAQEIYEKDVRKSFETGDSIYMTEANVNFHMTVARAGKNDYFTAYYQRLLDEARRIVHFHFDFIRMDTEITPETLGAPHVEMIAAIRAMDLDLAEKLAQEHTMQFKGRFMQFLMRGVTPELKLDSKI